MPLAKCMVVTSSNPTVIQAKIKQPSGVRMISGLQLKKVLSREELTFMAIPHCLLDEGLIIRSNLSQGLSLQQRMLTGWLHLSYYQVRIAQKDESKTTYVFHEYLDQFVVVYLDDIVVFSSSLEEQQVHMWLIFDKLRILKKDCTINQVVEERYDLQMGVLTQEGHPIAYESRKLNNVERRYPVYEKEMLDVVHCLSA
ncbi:RNA-directed DNA polymerase-like protein [Cucumis melo var. makuwa]|uniref:RNA-directed DNA polymerase-like protein n=1 Tax=Cucumis melo var. makuwa TaxID=1194695 RepID=A0A5A7VDZ7_CUCMM|nr:RNA-directed DNA polymerase-like protein [Cucumis melo var. makuwa]